LQPPDLPRRACGEADVGDVQTGAHLERADAVVRPVEIACRIAVDAALAARREAGGHVVLQGPLEQTAALPPPRSADEDHVRGLPPVAVGVARVPEEPVRRAIVPLLVALDHAVPASLALAGGRAAVARHRVAIVALLARLDHVVATDRSHRT